MVESELKSQLQEADTSKNGGYLIDVDALKEKVRKLEENLKDSDSKLFEARESVFELTALNIELTDELEFLKGTETYSEKMNSLEKQVRHLENELQKSKALTINSQEQQKELYMAIFDMETLIEDLKSKAFKAETRLEILEEQCLSLAENNSELDIQISCLQSKAETLEASLNQVHREKGSKVKDINNGAKVVADLVLQLALEREKIQKKVCSLAKENKILMEELRRSKINGKVDSTKEHKIESVEKLPEASSTTSSPVKVNDLVEAETSNENEEDFSRPPENAVSDPLRPETLSKRRTENQSIRFILMVILVPVFSAAVMLTALRHFLDL